MAKLTQHQITLGWEDVDLDLHDVVCVWICQSTKKVKRIRHSRITYALRLNGNTARNCKSDGGKAHEDKCQWELILGGEVYTLTLEYIPKGSEPNLSLFPDRVEHEPGIRGQNDDLYDLAKIPPVSPGLGKLTPEDSNPGGLASSLSIFQQAVTETSSQDSIRDVSPMLNSEVTFNRKSQREIESASFSTEANSNVPPSDTLRLFYEEQWQRIEQAIPSNCGYSWPHLLSETESCKNSNLKIMIVGQQPLKWGDKEFGKFNHNGGKSIVINLMDLYRNFNFGANYNNSPFWRASHNLLRDLKNLDNSATLLWSNLVKVCHNGDRSTGIEDDLCALGMLTKEILILNPDVVVFFTGPDYDTRICKTFPGVRLEEMKASNLRKLCRLKHTDLPFCSYRTYHPNYLQRSGQFDSVLTDIFSDTRANWRKKN